MKTELTMYLATLPNRALSPALAAVLLLSAACAPMGATGTDAPIASEIERGRYLVRVIGCGDCHTPLTMGPEGPVPDTSRLLSGHPAELRMPSPPELEGNWAWVGAGTNTAFAGPWGTSYATNLTPDEHAGIGIWTEEIFVNTIRSGRHWGVSRPILPPMPWEHIRDLTDADLRAVYQYLRTIPPVRNLVPDAVIAGE